MRVSVFAPAKINLSLHVGPPRADGRHPLFSVVGFADVGDVLTMEQGASALTVGGPFAGDLVGENLIARALAAYGAPARVHLQKNLPVASGIGGGSTDAAAALRGADALARAPVGEAALAARAAALGADVPVCVGARPALMSGAGEIVVPLALPRLEAVLVNPGVAVSTAAVYRAFDALALGEELEPAAAPSWAGPAAAIAALRSMRNDLERPALALAPAIGAALARLAEAPGVQLARMSGSGATCFALMETRAAAEALAAALAAERPDWWVRATRIGAVDAAPRPL